MEQTTFASVLGPSLRGIHVHKTRLRLNYEEEMLAVVAANVVVGFVGWVGGGWQLGFDG